MANSSAAFPRPAEGMHCWVMLTVSSHLPQQYVHTAVATAVAPVKAPAEGNKFAIVNCGCGRRNSGRRNSHVRTEKNLLGGKGRK